VKKIAFGVATTKRKNCDLSLPTHTKILPAGHTYHDKMKSVKEKIFFAANKSDNFWERAVLRGKKGCPWPHRGNLNI